jgi:cytochrome b pre-mRNA-processing protein 3
MLTFRRRQNESVGVVAALYAGAVARSRLPEVYAEMGAPDTVEGRFEMLTVQIVLLVERLNLEGESGRTLGQAVFDLYIRNLDSALREMGVGDLAVAKRMKQLGKIFYGRATAYAAAFQSSEPRDLEELISRTLLVERPQIDARVLARHVIAERVRLADTALDDLIRGGSA